MSDFFQQGLFSGNFFASNNFSGSGPPPPPGDGSFFGCDIFGSNSFTLNYFGRQNEEPPPPPPPPADNSGYKSAIFLGGGGGPSLKYEDIYTGSYKDSVSAYTDILTSVKRKLSKKTHLDALETLPRKKEALKDLDREQQVRKLRQRVTELEQLIGQIKQVRSPQARRQVRKLNRMVESLEARAKQAMAKLEAVQHQMLTHEVEQKLESGLADIIPQEVQIQKTTPLTYAALALASGLATFYVVPRDLWILKIVGYGTTAYLGYKAITT